MCTSRVNDRKKRAVLVGKLVKLTKALLINEWYHQLCCLIITLWLHEILTMLKAELQVHVYYGHLPYLQGACYKIPSEYLKA